MSDIPQKIRALVHLRSGYRCEVVKNGVRCPRKATEQHHMKKRSGGGKHMVENLIDCCRECHDIIERHFWKPENVWAKIYRISRYTPKGEIDKIIKEAK